MPLRVGQLVKFAAPDAGEESERFTVVELRGERVLVQAVPTAQNQTAWIGPPQFVYLVADLVSAD